MAPLTTVAICTFNREQMLLDAVGDVLAAADASVRVLVVDQTAQHEPAVAAQIDAWTAVGSIDYVRLAPPSLTRARNVALERAEGAYIIYVDDDVRIPDGGFIDAHRRALARPGVGGAAGRIDEPGRPPKTVARGVGHLGWFGTREPGFGTRRSGPAATVRGCNMSFRVEALRSIGGFDEQYTRSAFREDTDVSWRLRQAGYRLWFAADAWLWHLSADSGGTRDESIRVGADLIANDVYFAQKNLRAPQRQAWLLRCYASQVVKAGLTFGGTSERHRAFIQAMKDHQVSPSVGIR